MDEASLIRFVEGPGGEITPDLARKLPGRGLWVAADRAAVTTAAKKSLFSKAARKPLVASPDLADRVEALLMARLLAGLGLARKAGALTCGFEAVHEALASRRAAVLVEASDGAEDGRRKMLGAVRSATPPVQLIGLFSQSEMGLALGLENVVHTALLAGRSTDRWTSDARRLSGFRPLFPGSWSERP
jgi:predicted RNA-binding protein YlxR (DUF448 family)